MKAPTVILAASTVLLAGAVVYLARELGAARDASAEATRLAQYLTSRVVELERARTTTSAPGGPQAQAAPNRSTLPAGAPPLATSVDAASATFVVPQGTAPPKTPAMQRVQRSQARANAKRMYADFATEYGLSAEDSARLYELMADLELGYTVEPPAADPGAFESQW